MNKIELEELAVIFATEFVKATTVLNPNGSGNRIMFSDFLKMNFARRKKLVSEILDDVLLSRGCSLGNGEVRYENIGGFFGMVKYTVKRADGTWYALKKDGTTEERPNSAGDFNSFVRDGKWVEVVDKPAPRTYEVRYVNKEGFADGTKYAVRRGDGTWYFVDSNGSITDCTNVSRSFDRHVSSGNWIKAND